MTARAPNRYIYRPVDGLPEGANNALQQIADSLSYLDQQQVHYETNIAPEKPIDGEIRFADGTDWDPGQGRGMYWYDPDIPGWTFLMDVAAVGGGVVQASPGWLNGFMAFRALMVKFPGAAANGLISPDWGYNVDTVERIDVGEYKVTLDQLTFFGVNVIANSMPIYSHHIVTPPDDASIIDIHVEPVSPDSITVRVKKLTVTGGSGIAKMNPYDPVGPDRLHVGLLMNTGSGTLPPATL